MPPSMCVCYKCYAWMVVKAMEIPVMFQAVLTRVESQELSKPLTGKVGVPGVRIEPTTRGFSVRGVHLTKTYQSVENVMF